MQGLDNVWGIEYNRYIGKSRIPIQISIYDDRLYIANCGRLPETWTIENLMAKHASKPYNPDIARVLYLAGFIESWGRGIEKICDACRADGIAQPEYTVHPGDIMIKFTAPEDRVVYSGRRVTEKVTERVTERVTDKVTDRVTVKEYRILQMVLEDPAYTLQELAEKLGVSRKTIAAHIKSLKEKGIIQRVGSDRKGHWKVIEDEK